MDYRQYRRARKLVHVCCNYDNGNCILLDDGEECVCVQSISYSLLCRWFQIAVLPQDKPLEAALLHRDSMKRCVVCGQPFLPGSNRAKYWLFQHLSAGRLYKSLLCPKNRPETVRRGNFTYPGFSRSGIYLFLL